MTTDVIGTGADVEGPAGPSAPRPVSVLGRLTGLDPDRFGARHWGREPLLVTARDAAGFADLLDLDGADELLSRRGLRTPFLRLARNGSVVGSGSFTAGGGVGAEIADQVRDDKVGDLFAGGSTVVLQALHRTWSPIIDLAAGLTAELGHPVQVNAYITPSGSRGFDAHYDVHDVFVLQLAGRKRWTVHEPVHVDPLRTQPWNDRSAAVAARARDDAPAFEVELAPGDVMYLPRGWLHSATALGEVSAHLTVGIHVLTRHALVEALAAAVADDPRLRASLPLGLDVADAAQLRPHLDAVRAVLHEAVEEIAVEAVARKVRGRVWTGARLEPVPPLATAEFARLLAPGDRVRRRHGLGAQLRAEPGGAAVLELPDRQVRFPAGTVDAVRRVLDGDPVVVGELPGIDAADQVVLVRRLLREGVVVAADGARSARE